MAHKISYGSPSQRLIESALATFTEGRFADLSFCTTPIELLSDGGKDALIKHATGFYWQREGVDFVVTNWHVLSGRNPFTGQLLDTSDGFRPRRIKVYGWRLTGLGEQLEMVRTAYTYDLGLVGMEAFSSPPVLDGDVVDIAAIPLPSDFVMKREMDEASLKKWGSLQPRVNRRAQDKIASQAGDECVILGYPLANYSGLQFPIWKRGSLATETNTSIDGSPAFLIDAATSSAMSGSPVFRRVAGAVTVDPITKVVSEMRGFQFIGVYAGRLQSAELGNINLGYAWFANQVDAAVAHSFSIWNAVADGRSAGEEEMMLPPADRSQNNAVLGEREC